MNNNQLTEKLIQTIREYLPEKENMASVLMDILSLGKEATYRRLRGDVLFTLEDAAKISRKFGFSLDKVIGESLVLDNNKWAYTDIDLGYFSSEYMEKYKQRIKLFSDIFNNLSNQPQATIRIAMNHLPYYFTFPHKKLSLFVHYKKVYLTFGQNPGFRFSDFTKPQQNRAEELQLVEKYLAIPKHLLILDRNVFRSTMKDIVYFYQRKLISEEEFSQLKEELLEILSSLENITATGKFSSGSEVLVYLLDIELDTSYAHFEANQFACSVFYTYFIDTLSFYNSKACEIQKNWIESLKRYSTLITQTGEMQRVEFFNKQRELIETTV